MEVVLNSNLVLLENEKTKNKKKTNFQTMAMNSFVISHDLEAKWEPMYICKHEAIRSFTMAEL